MASPGNQHCANCIGTLSFPILIRTVQKIGRQFCWSQFSILEHAEKIVRETCKVTGRLRVDSRRPIVSTDISSLIILEHIVSSASCHLTAIYTRTG